MNWIMGKTQWNKDEAQKQRKTNEHFSIGCGKTNDKNSRKQKLKKCSFALFVILVSITLKRPRKF